jgi:hypothetical protein
MYEENKHIPGQRVSSLRLFPFQSFTAHYSFLVDHVSQISDLASTGCLLLHQHKPSTTTPTGRSWLRNTSGNLLQCKECPSHQLMFTHCYSQPPIYIISPTSATRNHLSASFASLLRSLPPAEILMCKMEASGPFAPKLLLHGARSALPFLPRM